MTLSNEANEIRSEVQVLRKAPGRRYNKALRKRVLSWMKRALDEGMHEVERMDAIASRYSSCLQGEQWIAATVVPDPVIPRPTESTALVPVRLRDDDLPFGPGISFSAPVGTASTAHARPGDWPAEAVRMLLTPSRAVRVFAYPAAVDLRKGYDGLYGLVQSGLESDPMSGDPFLFVNESRKLCKVLLWDGTGVCIFQKRLERGCFARLWRDDGQVVRYAERACARHRRLHAARRATHGATAGGHGQPAEQSAAF